MRTTTTRLALGSLAVTAALALPAAPAFSQTDLNCDDFPSQAAAQAELRRDPSDPYDLDRDDDLVACEAYLRYPEGSARDAAPARRAAPSPETTTAQTATAGVRTPTRIDTGAGGAAGPQALTGAAAAALTAAALGLVARQRRTRHQR